jgi:hypothetical protein
MVRPPVRFYHKLKLLIWDFALKRLSAEHGEVKSMFTAPSLRRQAPEARAAPNHRDRARQCDVAPQSRDRLMGLSSSGPRVLRKPWLRREALAELIADGVAYSTDLTPFDPIRLRPLDPSLLRSKP